MRIVSLLPAATEIVNALGMMDHVVGVSHEYNYPESARTKPLVTGCEIHGDRVPSRDIDREGEVASANDIAVFADGSIADSVTRYHDTIARLANRLDVRNESSRYEAVALALVNTVAPNRGELLTTYPPADDPLALTKFFPTLFATYDMRFVYAAPALKSVTQRLEWAADSPAWSSLQLGGLSPRIG